MTHSRHTGFFLYAAYGVVMLCMAALLYLSFNHLEVTRAARQIDLQMEEKVRAAFNMRDAIRKRSFILAYVTVIDDFFDRDLQRQLFVEAANDFVAARERLDEFDKSPRELEYLQLMSEQIRHAQPYMERAVNLAVEGLHGPLMESAITSARMSQVKLLNTLDMLVDHLDQYAQVQHAKQEQHLTEIRRDMMLLGGAMFVISLTIGLAVMRREADSRKRLVREVEERTQAENRVRELNRTLEVRVEKRTNELLASEVRSRAIVETAVEGIVTIDETGLIETVNPAAERIFGYTIEDLKGEYLSLLIPAAQSLHTGKENLFLGRNREADGVRKNGEVFPLSLAVSQMLMGGQRLFVGIVSDLTERKKVEAEKSMLAADHEIVAAILNASLAPIPLEDFLDEALRLVLTRQNLELLGMGAIFLREEGPQPKLKLVAQRNLASQLQKLCGELELGQCLCGRAALGETIIKTCLDTEHDVAYEGMREHGHMCIPISHGDQVLGVLNLYIPHGHQPSPHEQRLVETVAGTLAGVIRRKNAEEMARSRQDALAHVSRVNTMGELTASLAHEINQPLSAISNYATGSIRRLQAKTLDEESTRDVLNKIATQSERAGEVIRRIRSFVRKGEVSLEPLSLDTVVEDVLRFTSSEANRQGVDIRSECAPDVPTLMADKVQIEQVLLNIINNALDVLKSKPKDERQIIVKTYVSNDGHAVCSIWDNGDGLPQDQFEKVFEPFYSTKSKGMGMGLAICHSIIEASGGRLWIDPDCSQGTRFNFSLPITADQKDNADER